MGWTFKPESATRRTVGSTFKPESATRRVKASVLYLTAGIGSPLPLFLSSSQVPGSVGAVGGSWVGVSDGLEGRLRTPAPHDQLGRCPSRVA